MKFRFVSLTFLIAGAAGSSYAGTSVSLANTSASAPLPNTAPFNALGSYWIDYRITGWSIPTSGCGVLAHLPSGAGGTLQILLCEPARGFQPFILFPGNDGTPGGTGVLMAPPHIGVTSVTATNPMVVTLSSTPFPLTMAANATVTIAGAAGTGCAGLNANQKITAVSGNSITIAYDGTSCAYVPNSAAAYSQDFVMRYHRDLTASLAIGESWNVDGTGYAEVAYPITVPSLPTNPDSIILGPANA